MLIRRSLGDRYYLEGFYGSFGIEGFLFVQSRVNEIAYAVNGEYFGLLFRGDFNIDGAYYQFFDFGGLRLVEEDACHTRPFGVVSRILRD